MIPKSLLVVAVFALLLFGFASIAAAQATATVAGTVTDEQGAVVQGATISLISETRGTTFPGTTGGTGDFVITNVPGDTYTVSVTMSGFKKAERRGVLVVPGDRVALGAITLEVGRTDIVEVTAQAPLLQAQTGDRTSTVTQTAVEQVPTYTSGTFFAQAVSLVPGVSATASTTPTRLDTIVSGGASANARTNYMLDGVTSVNTGGNQPGINLNYDSIAEVRVLTNSYSAEYGRSSGIQVVGITKSGTNQLHGSAYDIENRSGWATNSWVNQQDGVPKSLNNMRYWGGTLGGPVGRLGKENHKVFFFLSEQVQPDTTGGAVNYFRVPTALERQGDFSQTKDNNGNLFNTIADPASGLPCTSTNYAGCFQDGGVVGRIPQSRLYQLGMNVLNQYPMPNANGLNYNLATVAPNTTTTNYQHVARIDYVVSPKLRISAKYAGQNTSINSVIGSIPGYNDRLTVFPALIVPSMTLTYIINSNTVLEGSYGYTRGNQLGTVASDADSNRCNIGLCNFPELFPNSLDIQKGSYQDKVLTAMKAPFYVNGVALLQPDYTWGSRIADPPPNNYYPPYLNWQYTHDVAIAVTKVWRTHTFKAGFVMQNSVKVQNLGTITTGTLPPEGNLAFDNNSNNPLDTGFGYANAAIGVFSSFGQQGPNIVEGRWVYHNRDFYIQDNWKVKTGLTLDLGVRFVHNGPQYDSRGQESNFFPNLWSASDAPYLFTPGCSVAYTATNPCPSFDRVAINPLTGASMGVGSGSIVGDIVPNSGNVLDGIVQAGHGISNQNYTEPWLAAAPRVGVAYTPGRAQKLVIRGGLGLFFDRPQGDSVFGQIGNPPVAQEVTVYNSTLQQVASGSASAYRAPPSLTVYNYNSKLPSSFQYNLGTQMLLPWTSSFDVSWVGIDNYNSIAYGSIGTPSGQLPMDLNAPDIGTAYLPQYQDPTLGSSSIPGATALTTNLLRPYRGLASITDSWPRFHSHYDSIQASFNRQYKNGVQVGFNYALGLRDSGNMLSPPQLTHLSNGTFQFSTDQSQLDSLINNVGLRRHTLKGYGVWQLPELHGVAKPVAFAANGWQLSGTFTAETGPTYDATYTYNNNGANVNITGSPSYAGRISVVGNPGSGCSGNQYEEFNTAAFAGPAYNSIGNESGSSLLHGCFDHTVNLAIGRYFHLGSERRLLQIRADAYNVFNALVINAVQTQMVLASPASPTTILNNQYNGSALNPGRLTPAAAGFGAATGAQPMRSIQLQARFIF
jgi:hypothetical protein